MGENWSNWSGNVTSGPQVIAMPDDDAAVAALVREAAAADREVRVVGTGHSFTPVAASDGLLLKLDRIASVTDVDAAAGTAWIGAGAKITAVGEPLRQGGLALANQGDIDVQAICGALATGTHGTGRTLGNLPTQLAAMRLVTAEGEIVELNADNEPDAFRAARVSLGMLGVATAVKLNCLPAYRLHEKLWTATVEECFGEIDDLIAGNRHFEFFWRPEPDRCDMKALNPHDGPPDPMDGVEGERVDHSSRIFPSIRDNKFNEMEYSVPAEAGPDCFHEIRALMQTRHPDVKWPVEYRTLAADDAMLSTAYKRHSVTISVHEAADRPYRDFFADCETIFRNHRGRPHWGKVHNLTANDFADLYREWESFLAIRRRFDPKGRFLNGYLKGIFE